MRPQACRGQERLNGTISVDGVEFGAEAVAAKRNRISRRFTQRSRRTLCQGEDTQRRENDHDPCPEETLARS